MKKRILLGLLLSTLAGVCVATDYTDIAQVVSSTPIIERVTDQRQEGVPASAAAPAPARERSLVGPIVGGVAGGVLGSQVGRGTGRTAATAAGAIAGTIIGDRVGNADADRVATAPPVQRCRIVETTRDVVKGYTVVYRYNGRDITTTMPYNPGGTVRVAVGVVDAPPAGVPAAVAPAPTVREVSTNPPPPPPPPGQGGYYYRY